ncbi:hypothetical protein Tco_1398658 [Tanacetum coccineum]
MSKHSFAQWSFERRSLSPANLKGFIDSEFPNQVYILKKAYTVFKQATSCMFIKAPPRGCIFISQSQYAIELLKKHGLDECVSMSTPMATERLDADLQGTPTDQTTYHLIWMRTQLLDYRFKYNRIPMYCDSKSAIAISCNPVQHSKTTNIDIRYHFIKEHVERGTVEIYFVGTEYQLADLFTKALLKECFKYLVHRIGMRCMTPTQLESLTKLSS